MARSKDYEAQGYKGGRKGYTTYRTYDGDYVTYDDDTDDAHDAMKDDFIPSRWAR